MTKRLWVHTRHCILDGYKQISRYYIKEKLKIKVAKWGTPKKYFFLKHLRCTGFPNSCSNTCFKTTFRKLFILPKQIHFQIDKTIVKIRFETKPIQ
jgi:hypothetical protein